MSLIQCPNCRKDISSTSIKCAYCGHLLNPENLQKLVEELDIEDSPPIIGFIKSELKMMKEAKYYGEYRWFILLAFFILGVGINLLISLILAQVADNLDVQGRPSKLIEGIMGVFFFSAVIVGMGALGMIYKKIFKADKLIKEDEEKDKPE
jgi:hypothetical protein